MSSSTIVIGGGVVGTATAYYLAKAGHKVTIVDQGRHGGACSHANCGYVSPSHVPPIPKPGLIGPTMLSMLSSESPFYIRPRISPSLWSFLLRFWWNCNEKQMKKAARGKHALLSSSRELYQELIEGEGLDCNWEKRGLLFVFKDQHHFDEFAELSEWVAEEFGVTSTPYADGELQKLEPALKDEVYGAWHYPHDAHLRPDRLLSSWKTILEQLGVKVLEEHKVTDFVGEGSKLKAIRCGTEELAADRFVVATGAWSPFFNRQLGCALRIQPGKGYSITMARPSICPKIPMLLEESRVGVTPFDDGYRLGSTMEFGGYDASINTKRLALLKKGASHYLKEPFTDETYEEWYGWRPMTPDDLPYIDFAPKFNNVLITAGHSMLGLSMGAGTGKLAWQLLDGLAPHIDPQPYRLR
ncbi:NAD(P)/FAD-dependent oxidoreductase [Bremerella sp. P1]|uniref:NAD(P)/FAD-dependent oxidoreductase n=1 Tax=Bremerella sp. P1 TaxID=3026424 RepID=UPI0023683013|nr:FAD-dependent oxidoreductase [Bremerella sp. P1]WDI40909.1 FAD-dependent oxidoreductase [Bremerella sp. P1]